MFSRDARLPSINLNKFKVSLNKNRINDGDEVQQHF